MAEQFIYRSVKKTKGTDVVGSSRVNQGTGGSGSSGGGGTTLNPTLGELINVSKSSDTQTEEKIIKWNPATKLWEPATPKTTIASLDNVDNNADATNPTNNTVFLGIEPGGNEYKQVYLADLLNGYVFEGDVSAQQEREFNVDFPEARPDTSYKLDVQGWKEQAVPFEGNNVVIRNMIQYHSLIKRVDGFSVKFFQIVDFLSYSALFKSNASPVPDFPHVTIRMSGAGLMDFSASGATGVKWVMSTGEVYTQGSQVPSGDINHPKIIFNEAGWVKLYVDDFSIISMLNDNATNNLCISELIDFKNCYRITLANAYNIAGHLSDVDFFDYFLTDTPLITGDLSAISFNSDFVYIRILSKLITGDLSDINNSNTPFFNNLYLRSELITGDLSSVNISCYNIDLSECNSLTVSNSFNGISFINATFRDCDFSQLEIYNLIKYNYDLNNTNKTLNITNNSIPDAATLAMITEMQTNRGWTILHD